LFSGVDCSDFIFVKIYNKFDVRKQKSSLNHKKIKAGEMSHTIYVIRIILRPLSALFGLQFMVPMEKSDTFTVACANEIIPNGQLARLLTKQKKEVMLELYF
jgi:hypothetical protein